jgi:hypothetical protein
MTSLELLPNLQNACSGSSTLDPTKADILAITPKVELNDALVYIDSEQSRLDVDMNKAVDDVKILVGMREVQKAFKIEVAHRIAKSEFVNIYKYDNQSDPVRTSYASETLIGNQTLHRAMGAIATNYGFDRVNEENKPQSLRRDDISKQDIPLVDISVIKVRKQADRNDKHLAQYSRYSKQAITDARLTGAHLGTGQKQYFLSILKKRQLRKDLEQEANDGSITTQADYRKRRLLINRSYAFVLPNPARRSVRKERITALRLAYKAESPIKSSIAKRKLSKSKDTLHEYALLENSKRDILEFQGKELPTYKNKSNLSQVLELAEQQSPLEPVIDLVKPSYPRSLDVYVSKIWKSAGSSFRIISKYGHDHYVVRVTNDRGEQNDISLSQVEVADRLQNNPNL